MRKSRVVVCIDSWFHVTFYCFSAHIYNEKNCIQWPCLSNRQQNREEHVSARCAHHIVKTFYKFERKIYISNHSILLKIQYSFYFMRASGPPPTVPALGQIELMTPDLQIEWMNEFWMNHSKEIMINYILSITCIVCNSLDCKRVFFYWCQHKKYPKLFPRWLKDPAEFSWPLISSDNKLWSRGCHGWDERQRLGVGRGDSRGLSFSELLRFTNTS